MKQKSTKLLALLAISIGLASIMLFMAGAQSAKADNHLLEGTPPPPDVTPTPTPISGGGTTSGGGTVVTTVTNIFHHLVFPVETISEALGKVFMDAANAQSHQLVGEYATWYQAIGEIVQAPSSGDYARVAQSSWPVAAALAPALFILRIALYNWNRLVGEEDSATRAAGDILTALVLAVLCGWFLDLVVRLGWWMTGAAMGESADLALGFIRSMSVEGIIQNMSSAGSFSIMLPILFIAVELGALLAVAGMLLAFAGATAGLFLLAVVGPSIAVASVIPQMRWLRSLWIKAVTVIALLPLVAGGIFKASTYMTNIFTPGGILALFIRIMWLWGATGAMLSLAGILGKLTISTTTDAIGQVMKAVQSVVTTAALAATGVGAVGAVGGVAGGAAGAVGATGAGAVPAAGGAAELAGGGGQAAVGGGMANASAHLGAAQLWSNRGAMLEAFGMHRPAQFARALSGSHSIAARQAELSSRMDKFQGEGGRGSSDRSFDDVGFEVSGGVRSELLNSFSGSPQSFQKAYSEMGPMLESHGITPSAFASQYPGHAGLMASIYRSEREAIDKSPDPLLELAGRAGAPKDLFGL
jgi:type IV secretion system protein VirB6